MLYTKQVSIRNINSLSSIRDVSPINYNLSSTSLTMNIDEFTEFLRSELEANRIPNRAAFVDNLIHRIRLLFTEEQILNCIITYLIQGLLDTPETHQSIIDALNIQPENNIFKVLKEEFKYIIDLYKSMSSGAYDPKKGVSCGVKKSIKRLGIDSHEKMKADAKRVLRNPHSILYGEMIRILNERKISPRDFICDFFNIVRNALIAHERTFFKSIHLREYLESLYEFAFEQNPALRAKTKVFGLLSDMEFLMSVYMDIIDEEKSSGFIYLSRLMMMTPKECADFNEAISHANNQEHVKTIRDEFARNCKAYNYIFHQDQETGIISGVLPRAINLSKKYMQKTKSKNKADLSIYFTNAFTQGLRALIESDKEAEEIFKDIYYRLIEPRIRNYDSIIFADTGYKGSLAVLACALCNIFEEGKHTGFYLYYTHKNLGKFIPALILEDQLDEAKMKSSGSHKLVERSVKKLHRLVIHPDTREPLLLVTPAKYLRFFDDLNHVYTCFRFFSYTFGVII